MHTPQALAPLQGISSMATRALLAQLLASYQLASGQAVDMLSIGGVDALKRVQANEAFDVAVLGSDAIAKLVASGHAQANSVTPLVRSGVAVAVRAGSALPDLSKEAAVKAAVLAAPSISYSTGPSGVALAQLFERWGIAQVMAQRTITPPPGTPVASVIASGQAALGFQQLSELLNVSGITIAGPLPDDIQITTVFSACVLCSAQQPERSAHLLAYLACPNADAAKRAQGMTPA
jgi:molybdate transport system substrate-binding protein